MTGPYLFHQDSQIGCPWAMTLACHYPLASKSVSHLKPWNELRRWEESKQYIGSPNFIRHSMTLKMSRKVTEPLLNTESNLTESNHLRTLYVVIAFWTIIVSSLRMLLSKKELWPQGLTLTTVEPQNKIKPWSLLSFYPEWKMQVITPKERHDSLETPHTKPDSQPVPCRRASG